MRMLAELLSRDRGTCTLWLLFAGVAVFLGWNADSGLGFGPDQVAYALLSQELLDAWEQGEPLVNEFGPVHRQLYSLLHAAGWLLLGSAEASYRLILIVSALLYLVTMYLLLNHVVENRTIAAVTAVLSIVQRYTIGTSFWGMGEFRLILPRIVVLAVFPLAWLLFERHLRSRRAIWAFMVVGFGFALHLSAAYFYCILLMSFGLFVLWKRQWASLVTVALATIGLFFFLNVVPSTAWSHRMEQSPALAIPLAVAGCALLLSFARSSTRVVPAAVTVLCLALCTLWLGAGSSFPGLSEQQTMEAQQDSDPEWLEAQNRAIYARFGWTLFPISSATIAFAVLNGGLLAAIALSELIHRWRRRSGEREALVACYVLATFVVSFGLTGAVQLYCRIQGQPDIVLELFRAFRFIFLPMYIYLALFLHRIWHEKPWSSSRRVRVASLLLIGVLLVPPRFALAVLPDQLKLWVRSVAESTSSMNEVDTSQQKYLRQLLATDAEVEAARAQHQDYLELCAWVRGSTDKDSVFMTTDYDFIHYTGRDIMISYAQGAGSARSMAAVSGVVGWHEAYLAVTGAFASGSGEQIMEVAQQYEVDYVVTNANQEVTAPVVFSNHSFKLYRIRE